MPSNTPYVPKFLSYRTATLLDMPSYGANENVDPTVALDGSLYVTVVSGGIIPPAPPSFGFFNVWGNTGPLNTPQLVTINGFNPPTNPQVYLQLFLTAPLVPGAVPDLNMFSLAPGASFSWTPAYPLSIPAGAWGISSTPNVYTVDPSIIWFHGEGELGP